MQHPDEGTIHAWLDGALSADEAARLEAHVKDCPQCQAAVAEARGFIAASSRILTALDNAPRGVIPAAAPRKRVQPWVWRVAATVLVVATGTLVLLRERGTTESHETVASDSAPLVQAKPAAVGSVAENAPAVTRPSVTQQNAPLAAIPSPYQQNATAGAIAAGPMAAATPSRAPMLSRKTAAPRGTEEQELSAGNAQSRARLGGQQGAVAEMGKASTVQPAPASVPTRALSAQTYSALSASNAVTLRQVNQKRIIGGTQTFYELAPGDTVVLEEQSNAQLQSVVVTGAAAGAARADRRAEPKAMPATDKAAAAPEAAQKTVTPAPPPSATLLDAASLDVHSISWLDRSSGRVLILSGRHTQEELEQIRKRIEQVRAAEQSKRNPE